MAISLKSYPYKFFVLIQTCYIHVTFEYAYIFSSGVIVCVDKI